MTGADNDHLDRSGREAAPWRHSNPTTTRNIYAHELKPMQEEAKRAQAGILAAGR
jgi:hypothetical protein